MSRTTAHLRLSVLAAMLGCSLSAQAQQAGGTDEEELALVYGDKATVSIATGAQQSLRRAPAVATVITAQDIAAMGATDLDQVLETVPGVHVNRGANMYSPLYVVRGIVSQFTPQILVLQNGVPITTLFQGNKGNLWGGYPVDHIARIEILRGPGSALYGSDAFSGVINIITKNAADIGGTEAGVRAGAFQTRDVWLQHGGKVGAASVAAYLRAGSTDGFRSIVGADAQSRNDSLFGTRASLAPGPVNVGAKALDANLDVQYDKWRLRAGAKVRYDLGSGAGVAQALDPVGRARSERYMADLSWQDNLADKDWTAGAVLSTMKYLQASPVDFQLLPPGATLPTGSFPAGMFGGPDTWERQWRLQAFVNYAGWVGHNLRLGVGHDDLNMYRVYETRNFNYTKGGTPIPLPSVIETSLVSPFVQPHLRRIDYAYLQDEWQFAPDWTVTAGIRHDRYSDFGGTTNPRLALVWDASLNVTAKLLYGRAFRAPSFVEAYGQGNPVSLGNPNLSPEKNGTLEMAVAWQAAPTLQVNLNLYRYAMDNIIRTVPNAIAGTGSTYANTGGQNGRGGELEATWTPSHALRLIFNLARQHSTDEATNTDAGYAPHTHAYLRADWQALAAMVASVQLNHVGGRARAAGDARKPIADYTTTDLSLRSNRGKQRWDVAAALRNVFNADVREPSLAPGLSIPNDLPMAPRALTLQAIYNF
ncbi:TonB-dependent siderophore receptor [Massilia sp. TS11]|uniref:TonB-dependent receptor plug domain-containing protein n=1 Tax=Massilia sp. TS11 TaxID=2908003 RepID=UPI001EDB7365|nr:TonB-dependent receptor [Massilia sp. TS11]MCG2583303.1 TonB-dependent receptor [Massilia sp. TS11]